jgi:site-specific DNA recombinase
MPSTNGHGPERVALYLRVSGEEQREKATIEIQREFLDGYCQLHGLEVAGWYEDDGVSGAIPLHERPDGRRLLEDAKAGKFQTVLVYRLDRFGRSLLGIVDAHDRLEALQVALRSTTEPVDTSNPSGRLIFQMLASFAEYERGTIRERTQAGLHRAYRDGKQSGIIPYGYDVGEDGRLRVVEDEARIVREIISNIAAGATLYSEASRLNAISIPGPGRKYGSNPRTPSEKWTVATLSKLVHRTIYSGTRRFKINSGAGLIEGDAPPIVEPELQEKAVSKLTENRRFNKRLGDRRYLLTGLITCEVCGSTCVGHPSKARGKQRHYYVCGDNRPERHHRAGKGHAPYVRAEWLESLVWADMRRFLENPGEVLEQVREQMGSDDVLSELEGRRESLEKRLAAKHKERDRWLHLYAQDHISDAELEMHLADLRGQLDNLKLLLGSVEDELEGRRARVEVAESAEAWLMTLRERVEELEEGTEEALEKRRELAKLLVERIGVGRDEDGHTRVEITYRFDPPPEPHDEPPGEGSMWGESPTPRAGPTRRRTRTPRRSPRGDGNSGSRPWSCTRNTL